MPDSRSGSVDLEPTVVHDAPAHDERPAYGPGSVVGRYVVLGEAGRGGMGRVLRAYDPKLRREVALKLLRTDAWSEGRARIVREAQAMARLSHPNIVAIYDADEVDEQPYLAMEFIEGKTLKDWLADRPPWRDVVAVLLQAGRGLTAAHAAGIIHRDFKPANCIVGTDGRVRVTDFGIARALGEPASAGPSSAALALDEEGLTAHGTVVGTPPYLAPELEEGSRATVRSDVFAFCVTAWEALYGARPFLGTRKELAAAKRLGPPKPPSTSDVPPWVGLVIARGLATDPSLRFASIEEVGSALVRDPARRRRATVAVAGMALAGVVVIGAWQWRIAAANAACATAAAEITRVWDPARASAVEAAFAEADPNSGIDTADRVATRLASHATAWQSAYETACVANVARDTSAADWHATRVCLEDRRDAMRSLVGRLTEANRDTVRLAVTAVERLPTISACADPTFAARIVDRSDADPETVAALRAALADGAALLSTGQYAKAHDAATAVLDDAEAAERPAQIVAARLLLGSAAEKRGDLAVARASFARAYHDAGANGLDDLAAEAAARLTLLVGYVQREVDRGLEWAAASQMWIDRIGDRDGLQRATQRANLGSVYFAGARYDEARAAFDEALAIREELQGAEHPDVGVVLANLALLDYAVGDHDRALAQFDRVLAIQRGALGPQHPDVARSLGNAGSVWLAKGDLDRAAAALEEAVAILEVAYGPEHPDVGGLVANLGSIAQSRGDLVAATRANERALAIFERSLGREHPNVAMVLNNLGAIHHGRGDSKTARTYFDRAVESMVARLGADHPDIVEPLVNAGMTAFELGDLRAARPAFERAVAISEATFNADDARTGRAVAWLARLELAVGQTAAGRAHAERAITILSAAGPEAAGDLASVREALAEGNRPG